MGRTKRNWTPQEDVLLRAAVDDALANSRPLLWRELAKSVPGRTNKDCRRRWWNALAEGIVKGPWSETEDERLFDAVLKFGTQWSQIARAVGSRNSEQCSSHWGQVLNPSINHCDWSREEDQALLHAVLTHGTNWTMIAAAHVPKRTTLALKNRYSTLRLRYRNQHEDHSLAGEGRRPVQNDREPSSTNSSPGQQPAGQQAHAVPAGEAECYEDNDNEDEDEDEEEDDEEGRGYGRDEEDHGRGDDVEMEDPLTLGLSAGEEVEPRDKSTLHRINDGIQRMDVQATASTAVVATTPGSITGYTNTSWASYQGTHNREMMGHPSKDNGSYRYAPIVSEVSDFSAYPSLQDAHHYTGEFLADDGLEGLWAGASFPEPTSLPGSELLPPSKAHRAAGTGTAIDTGANPGTGTNHGLPWSAVGTVAAAPSVPSPEPVGQHPTELAMGTAPRQQQQEQQQHKIPREEGRRSYDLKTLALPVSPPSSAVLAGDHNDVLPSAPRSKTLCRVSIRITCDQDQLISLMSGIASMGTQLSVQVEQQDV